MNAAARAFARAKGQAVLELAIVSLLFVLVVVGVIEGGRAVWNYNTLAHATREGARYAIVHGSRASEPSGPGSPSYLPPDGDANVSAAVQEQAGGLDTTKLTVRSEWLDGDNQRGSRVKVSTEYEFASIFTTLFQVPPIPFSSSSTMEITY